MESDPKYTFYLCLDGSSSMSYGNAYLKSITGIQQFQNEVVNN